MKKRKQSGIHYALRTSVMLPTVALSIGLALPVGAQESGAAAPDAPTTEQTAPAAKAKAPAQSVAAADDISEVIVTARRIQERLQDVPIAITVFNQDQLTEKNVLSGRDLATYTPSLSVNGRYGTENASFAIRGFTQEIRTTPSVGMYFADVVAPRGGGAGTPSGDGAGPGSFFDLQNVQVVKGPQGTLFGRNTTGGAILLVPQKPTANTEGYVDQTVGNYGAVRTQAVANMPISDHLRFRLGVDNNKRDGYLNNTSGIGPSHFQDVDYTAVRGSLVWDVTPSVENYTIASYSHSATEGQVPRMFTADQNCYANRGTGAIASPSTPGSDGRCATPPPVAGVPQPPGGFHSFSGFAQAQLASGGNDGRFDVQSDHPLGSNLNDRTQFINTTSWLATDELTVKNIVSYATLVNDLQTDLFGTDFFVTGPDGASYQIASAQSATPPGVHSTDQSTMTEELQLQGRSLGGDLVWQTGAYYESSNGIDPTGAQSAGSINCKSSASLDCYDVLGAASHSATGVGSVNWQVGTIDFRNLGIYTQSTYSITDQLKATGGIRYTKDHSESDTQMALWRFLGSNYRTPTLLCNNSDSGHSYTEVIQTGPDANGNWNTAACRVQYSKNSSAPTWVLGLDYKPIDDLLVYGKYSRGYRAGAVQPFSPQGLNTFDPEKVDAYEAGFKASFHGAVRGTFNASVFYNDLQDQQLLFGAAAVDFSTGRQVAPPNAAIFNAGKSEIKGAEVELTLLPFRGMNLSVSYTYLDTKVKEVTDPSPSADSPYNVFPKLTVEGDPLPYSTKDKVSATAVYTLPLDPKVGQVSVGLTYSYQGPLFITHTAPAGVTDYHAGNPYGTIPSISLVNMNLGWNSIAGSNVDAALFATNLLDKEYRSAITNSYGSFGFETEIPGEPRFYGARVRVNFGS
ncbi:MAG: TonB-dependent receptor [Hydrocarboniphaga sp.]|uniref:TonB-dependent receptor n=1 Tax=Hydrocarboniphaga sp. TaxID=2033016 RepID=UPI0026318335|nr:TonB-dependent receptor [Hydrocarboniphaga sp.]MDB5973088.1 TonB-dependent receptor [Hydrocarboniphaga sp.]